MPRALFTENAVPKFDEAPSAVLVVGDVEFFVEEAAGKAREILGGGDAEVLRFDDDAPPEAVSDALLNRSLFSPRRIVELDISRLLGTETPGRLLTQAKAVRMNKKELEKYRRLLEEKTLGPPSECRRRPFFVRILHG